MHYMNDMYELAMVLCGMDPDNEEQFEAAEAELGHELFNRYGIDDEQFETLVKDLVKFTVPTKDGIGDGFFQGFANVERCVYLYKQDFKPKKED